MPCFILNQFDNKEDNYLLEIAYNFFAVRRDQYLANYKIAKQSLEYLFKENLPTFLGIEFNF